VTDILAPANLAVSQLLMVSWNSAPGLAGLGWGVLTATFCGLIPYGIVMSPSWFSLSALCSSWLCQWSLWWPGQGFDSATTPPPRLWLVLPSAD
jgi:hypothetical protein